MAPRDWRDGLGLLYDLRRGTTELEAVLRYAVHAATADRLGPTDEAAERALWDWAQQTAGAADTLSRLFRRTLVDERKSRLRVRAAPGTDAGTGRTAGSRGPAGDHPARMGARPLRLAGEHRAGER